MRQLVTVAALLAVAGCVGSVYRQENWTNTDVEADWDLASAVCLQYSEILTEQDHERIAQIKQSAATLANASGELSSHEQADAAANDDSRSHIGAVIGLLGSGFASVKATTAESKVQREKFASCLRERGWK